MVGLADAVLGGHCVCAEEHTVKAHPLQRRLGQGADEALEQGQLAEPVPGAVPSDGDERKAFWGTPRTPMTLAISEDSGRTWPIRRNLDVGDGYCLSNNSRDGLNREYSYPSIRQGPDGALNIAYTYFRQAIKFVRVDAQWVYDGTTTPGGDA